MWPLHTLRTCSAACGGSAAGVRLPQCSARTLLARCSECATRHLAPSALQTAEAALKEVQKSVAGFKAPQGKDLSTALRQYAEVAQGGRWNLKQDIRGAAEQERERLEAGLAGTKPRKPSKKRSAERSPLGQPQGMPPPGAAALEEAHSGKRLQHLLPGVLLSCAGWPSKLQSQSSHRASCLWEACRSGCCRRAIFRQAGAQLLLEDMLSSS